jgi:hypothetical protein
VFGNLNERDTVAVIADLVLARLESEGIEVELLPATVPPGYVADAFVSIHADGNPNRSVGGFKIAGPRRDYSGRSSALVEALYDSYASSTNLDTDPSISRRMTAYYAFNWPRYEHAVHPYTPSVIVETGFLTNATDRSIIVDRPELAAEGIANGILAYLSDIPDPTPPPQTLVAPNLPIIGQLDCAPIRRERQDRETDCLPSIQSSDGAFYAIISDTDLATTTFPYEAEVNGDYYPVQTLSNYFWFRYEVSGLIENATVITN